MPIARVKHWSAGDEVDANDLENEFNNITDQLLIEPFVAGQQIDLNGQLLILDADGDTLLDASTDDQIDVTLGGVDDFRFEANIFRAMTGSDITLDDGNVNFTSGDAVFTSGRLLQAKGADVTAASAITMPTDANSFDIIGTADIDSFSATQAGSIFYARCTGTGLNINHNAVSLISPWGRDYRTVPNEVICLYSLGGGNYQFWSVNGPKDRVGVTIEGNVSTAPAGYLDEETTVSRTTYSGLFAEIGTQFGVGDGSTTFDLPASKGRTAINVDGSANRITAASTNGANADTLGGVGGTETHPLVIAEQAAHTHAMLDSSGDAMDVDVAGGAAGQIANWTLTGGKTGTNQTTGSSGGGGAHSNTQPWIAKRKFIRF
jgi:microcystin-dependent protein